MFCRQFSQHRKCTPQIPAALLAVETRLFTRFPATCDDVCAQRNAKMKFDPSSDLNGLIKAALAESRVGKRDWNDDFRPGIRVVHRQAACKEFAEHSAVGKSAMKLESTY
jgi:hypothetical protein